ncbi:hypothetical protein L7F22_002394 [Adiantum nelumboides]|nr:hypothetical protein [Adiantum nelumboides]
MEYMRYEAARGGWMRLFGVVLQYLVLAKILLVDSFDDAWTSLSPKASLPFSITWWKRRVLLANHYLILVELLPSLYTGITTLKLEECVVNWGADLDSQTLNKLSGAAQHEYGFIEYAYGHVDQAKSRFEAAREAYGLELSLTGALGFRTAYHTDPKAHKGLVASTASRQASKEVEQFSLQICVCQNKHGGRYPNALQVCGYKR